MKVKVILKEDIKGVGKKDQVIEVKDGYANNFLIKLGKGVLATTENINKLNAKNLKKEKTHDRDVKKAKEIKEIIESKEITLKVKAGENGKVFGSIGAKEIADAVQAELNVSLDKKKMGADARVKSLGKHEVTIKLHSEVKGIIKLNVINI